MKKLIALLLALCLICSLVACGKKAPDPETQVDEDGPGGLEDVSDPFVEDISNIPGTLPLGEETISGEIIEIPEEGDLEYLGSKVVSDDYGDPLLLSWFNFYNTCDEENSVSWGMTIYAFQNDEELWTDNYTYNDVALDESLSEEIEPGDSLQVCTVFGLDNLTDPVILTFSDTWEELEPVELTVDLSEVEICIDVPEGISGYFKANYLLEGEKTATYEELVEMGMADNTYVELFGDGTGIFCFNGYEYDVVYDEEYIYIDDDVYYYTLEDEYFMIEGDEVYYEYIRAEEPTDTPTDAPEAGDFSGETVTTPKGYVSITLDQGWYVDEEDHGYTMVLYHEDLGTSKWIKIIDNQLTSLEEEMEYTQLSLASSVYEEVTIGGNDYQMLADDEWPPVSYLVAETSTAKAFVVEVRNLELEDVMTMLESIEIH